jgi:hypothetical protein
VGWEDKWIDVAEQIVRDEFKHKYADLPGDSDGGKGNSIPSPKKKKVHNIFNNLPSLAAPKAAKLCDELACYLITDPEQVVDVLMWWWTEHKATYPCLAHMALNYLSIPGTSLPKVLN